MKGHPLTLESFRKRIAVFASSFLLFYVAYNCWHFILTTDTCNTFSDCSATEIVGGTVIGFFGLAASLIAIVCFFMPWSKEFDDDDKPKKRRKKQ